MSSSPYKGATCRGSYALNTACGKCERCADELERIRRANVATGSAPPLAKVVEDKPLTLHTECPGHIIGALERSIARLTADAKKMAEAGDYDCMFFEGDADSLTEVLALLRTFPVKGVGGVT